MSYYGGELRAGIGDHTCMVGGLAHRCWAIDQFNCGSGPLMCIGISVAEHISIVQRVGAHAAVEMALLAIARRRDTNSAKWNAGRVLGIPWLPTLGQVRSCRRRTIFLWKHIASICHGWTRVLLVRAHPVLLMLLFPERCCFEDKADSDSCHRGMLMVGEGYDGPRAGFAARPLSAPPSDPPLPILPRRGHIQPSGLMLGICVGRP